MTTLEERAQNATEEEKDQIRGEIFAYLRPSNVRIPRFLVTDSEEALAAMLMAGVPRDDEGASEEALEAWLSYAQDVALDLGIVMAVTQGDLKLTGVKDGKPTFSVTAQGEALVDEMEAEAADEAALEILQGTA